MNHLVVSQNSNLEILGNSSNTIGVRIIEKLYELAHAGLDSSSSLSGNLQVSKAYRDSVEWLLLNTGLNITVADGYYIRFADPEVARVLNTQYGDGIGVTESAAAAVTRFNKCLYGNTTIEHFDELGKFTSITFPNYDRYYSPVGDFIGCTNLKSIDLSNVTEIVTTLCYGCTSLLNLGDFHPTWLESERGYGSAFGNCSSLTSIDLSNCITVGRGTFSGCTSLSNIGSFLNMDAIHPQAFMNCTSLNIDVRLPALGNNVASLYDPYLGNGRTLSYSAFQNSGVISVSDLGNCNYFEDGAASSAGGCFSGCLNLTFINLPLDFYYIGSFSFHNCSSLNTVNGIEHVTTINWRAFYRCTGLVNSVLYCRDTVTLGCDTFREMSIKGLYFPSLTVTAGDGYYSNLAYYQGTFAASQIKLLYFKDVTTFHIDFPRSNIGAIVINNAAVPSINPQSDDFSNTSWNIQPERIFEGATIGAIYVPDTAVTAYQSHSIWGTKTIKPISELNKVATKALWDQLTDALKDITLIEEYM